MKTFHSFLFMFCLWSCAALSAQAQGTVFTYQGRLDSGGTAYNGAAEFEPTLWNAASGGSQVAANTPASVIAPVTNGLFTLPVNFGSAPFAAGADRWLQIGVRTTIGNFTTLTPRQALTSTPYAITAGNLGSSLPVTQLSGQLTGAQIADGAVNAAKVDSTQVQLRITGTAPVGQFLTGIAADGSVSASADTNNWKLGGNAGTTAATQVLGTTDNQPLELRVNGRRALRLQITADYGFIGGGAENTVSGAFGAVVAGYGNISSGYAATAMGRNTIASGDYSMAMGQSSTADGHHSFAGGREAHANGDGCFIWADGSDAAFAPSGNNSFYVRATGGVRFTTAIDGSGGSTAGVVCNSGAGSWSSVSDRNGKEHFTPVDAQLMLARVAAMPLTTWNYKSQDKTIRHIGPMAQDFKSAFEVGEDDVTIATVDADGVALAAIQGLNQKLEAEVKSKDVRIAELEKRLSAIEVLLQN